MALLDQSLFHYSLLSIYLIGPPTFISLKFLQAPYGKHHRPGWGPTISPPLAWILMESPTLWLTLLLFPYGQHFTNPKALILMSPFLFHYFHRTCIYPLRIYRNSKTTGGFPVSVAVMAFGFNLLNAYLQARWVSHYKSDYDGGLFWWRFFGGLVIVEWFGWAVMTWSWAGFGFLLYTCANLVPRACANHKWYLEKFREDYPKNRKAVIPFLC
ncbi:steroid 5-alpha-reductase DET2 [Populus alba x Populus x berolinensis]|uniref:Steroid 5-alpha-reductase DET2 n=1 Tax=Populus alba x Populus x berolinensis TaxID=444605 RepID=A0AAD6PV06_9ROSI|nr:steroid 5-alpha-reductase DET2 [Populus alba x Populus x berolinensis]